VQFFVALEKNTIILSVIKSLMNNFIEKQAKLLILSKFWKDFYLLATFYQTKSNYKVLEKIYNNF
jgi:hypothetical protein